MDVTRPVRLMFLGFGEAASLFAKGFADAGLARLSAYDPSVEGGPGEALLRDRAASSGTVLLPGREAFSDADWVFAMVPPAKARVAAADVAPHLKAGAFYVDFSSASPADKRAAADIVGARGTRYVDAGIIGSVPASGHRVPVIASGPAASAFRDVFTSYGMDIALVGGEIGTAAGTKLIRSILAKGLEALYVEALVVAERSGVTEEVLDSFCAFLDARSARETAALLLRSHVVHAARRADEVLMSRELVLEAGVSPFMTDAIISVMQQTAGTSSAERAGRRQPDSLEDALAVLETELPGSAPGAA
ncbi:NAD(P)-dependent oxidoreductase [Mesorhizobium sp. DCY119]|uniref:NAD(P)-dependent oxidoreductase n=1 Tax=Mesorhizobium sp. DCY119 TaxID=2108445 RepID=UPI001403EB04|nr:NAD(P)-dependent oxidoreductase [Mesorhizobium sp. DCY119]